MSTELAARRAARAGGARAACDWVAIRRPAGSPARHGARAFTSTWTASSSRGRPRPPALRARPARARTGANALPAAVQAALPPGGIAVDGGAYIGYVTLQAARAVGPTGESWRSSRTPGRPPCSRAIRRERLRGPCPDRDEGARLRGRPADSSSARRTRAGSTTTPARRVDRRRGRPRRRRAGRRRPGKPGQARPRGRRDGRAGGARRADRAIRP